MPRHGRKEVIGANSSANPDRIFNAANYACDVCAGAEQNPNRASLPGFGLVRQLHSAQRRCDVSQQVRRNKQLSRPVQPPICRRDVGTRIRDGTQTLLHGRLVVHVNGSPGQ
jgi:hypothetical protein